MHSINMPTQVFADVYILCIGRTKTARQLAFEGKIGDLVDLCRLYDRKMNEHAGHEIVPILAANVAPLDLDDYKNLYDDKLRAKDGGARSVYDALLASGKTKGCCYCTYGDTTELDHLLPHHRYAEYSIYPKNLIPSCHRCNEIKLAFWPRTQHENFIHPYFEDYSQNQWLAAEVIFAYGQPVVRYWVSHADFDDASIPVRIENQFNRLGLAERYSVQAGREITARKVSSFQSAFDAGGSETLMRWLTNEHQDQFRANRNSWQTLAYRAFLESAQFCNFQW